MVYSGNETLRLHGEALYASVQLDSKAHLVLDAPWGYTLFKLSQLPRPVLVVTGSSSEPYLRDLLDLEPEGLLARPAEPRDVLGALERVAHGEKFYEGPVLRITLQPCERAVLRRVAFGMENPQIAQELNIS